MSILNQTTLSVGNTFIKLAISDADCGDKWLDIAAFSPETGIVTFYMDIEEHAGISIGKGDETLVRDDSGHEEKEEDEDVSFLEFSSYYETLSIINPRTQKVVVIPLDELSNKQMHGFKEFMAAV